MSGQFLELRVGERHIVVLCVNVKALQDIFLVAQLRVREAIKIDQAFQSIVVRELVHDDLRVAMGLFYYDSKVCKHLFFRPRTLKIAIYNAKNVGRIAPSQHT